jgi:DNA primase
MPIGWEQLAAVKGGAQWTIVTAREYLSFEQHDPWADYWTTAQTLARGMKTLGFKAPAVKDVAAKASARRNAAGDKA